MTSPVYQSSVGLIVRDDRRHEFATWDRIKGKEASLQFGIENVPGLMERAHHFFLNATLVPIEDMEEQRRILDAGAEGIDAIFDMSEEAAAWSVLYPSFSLVVPKPAARFPVGYAVAHGNGQLLSSVNGWLAAERAQGTVDTLYEYWMLGGAAKTRRSPRWSVIRDVLGWVE